MKTIFLLLILSSFMFSCKVVLENRKDVLKIDREHFQMLFVPAKYYSSIDWEKLKTNQVGKINTGKANDINFINLNLRYLRDYRLLKKNMFIYITDIDGRIMYPATSNFRLTKQDSLNPYTSKKLKSYFILRKYQ